MPSGWRLSLLGHFAQETMDRSSRMALCGAYRATGGVCRQLWPAEFSFLKEPVEATYFRGISGSSRIMFQQETPGDLLKTARLAWDSLRLSCAGGSR